MDLPEILLATGRVLLGGLFVAGGVRHVFVFPMVLQKMQDRGVVAARFLLVAGTLFQTVAGACLMAGIFVFPAALAWPHSRRRLPSCCSTSGTRSARSGKRP